MRIFYFLIICLLVFALTNNEAFAQACVGSTKQIENLARSYMKAKNLIHEGDEQDFPKLGVKIGWELIKVEPLKRGCAAVMSVCNSTSLGKSCEEGPIEVLGLVENKGVISVVPFEALYPTPQKVIAKIGSKESDDLSYYHALLTGESALAATKSFIAKIPYFGFSGVAVLGKKAKFDSTPNRNWEITHALFDLRRGSTAEVLDIQAYQLDGLDSGGAKGYWSGCTKFQNKKGTCSVAPWGQAFIRDLKPVN